MSEGPRLNLGLFCTCHWIRHKRGSNPGSPNGLVAGTITIPLGHREVGMFMGIEYSIGMGVCYLPRPKCAGNFLKNMHRVGFIVSRVLCRDKVWGFIC